MRMIMTVMVSCLLTVNAAAFDWTLKGGADPDIQGRITNSAGYGWGQFVVRLDGGVNGWSMVQRCSQNENPPYTVWFISPGTDAGSARIAQIIQAFDPEREDWLQLTQTGSNGCVDNGIPEEHWGYVRIGAARLYPGGFDEANHPVHWIQANAGGRIFGDLRNQANPCNAQDENGQFVIEPTEKQEQLVSAFLQWQDGDTLTVEFDGCSGIYSKIRYVVYQPQDPYAP